MKIFAYKKIRIVLAAAVVLVAIGGVFLTAIHPVESKEPAGKEQAAKGEESDPWVVRCNEVDDKSKRGRCEMFQRLVVAKTGERVAEFAIGFPTEKDKARGAIILPLGIALADGAQMKIDDGQAFKFNMRYCLKDGCYAFLNMNDKLLDMMRKGSKVTISFKTLADKEVNIVMSLSGFTKALKQIS